MLHCACWIDGDPCCWCSDDTDEDEATPPPCSRTFTDVDCIADLRRAVRTAEDDLDDAIETKRLRLALIASAAASLPTEEQP